MQQTDEEMSTISKIVVSIPMSWKRLDSSQMRSQRHHKTPYYVII